MLRTLAFAAVCAAMLFQPAAAGAQQAAGEDRDEERSVRRLGDVVSAGDAEFSMEIPNVEAPPRGERPDVSLPDPDRNARLQALLDRRAVAAGGPEIDQAFRELVAEIRAAGLEALASGDLAGARTRDAALQVLAPAQAIGDEIETAAALRTRTTELEQRLDQALADGQLLEPADGSAIAILERLRDAAPQAGDVASARVSEALRGRFDALLSEQRLTEAADWIEGVAAVELLDLEPWRIAFRSAAEARIAVVADRVGERLEQGDPAAAERGLQEMAALGAAESVIEPLASRLDRLRRYGGYRPGQRFSDAPGDNAPGPEMVVVPIGAARLGSPPDESGRFGDEGPTFRVEFDRAFAMSRTEITVGQFRAFVGDTGYRTDAERDGSSNAYDERSGGITGRRLVNWQRDYAGDPADDNLPVVHVSFNDARAYADWLARKTGKAYRLPSEAEFEYALRAGTASRFWWGDGAPEEPVENLAGERDRLGRDQRWSDAFEGYRDGYWGPAPAASFVANPFGLHDLGGNVLEWVGDCWIGGYDDPPVDGAARLADECDRRVLRGGAWSNGPAVSRSAHRLSGSADFSDARVGFRVARDLVSVADR